MRLAVDEFKTVLIYSGKFWNDTSIEIRMGEEYIFEAEGKWKDWMLEQDADGYKNWYMNIYNNLKRSKKNKWFSLMGSLDKRDLFLIGKSKQILFKKGGLLYCFANDVCGFYWNNSGYVTLKITRVK